MRIVLQAANQSGKSLAIARIVELLEREGATVVLDDGASAAAKHRPPAEALRGERVEISAPRGFTNDLFSHIPTISP